MTGFIGKTNRRVTDDAVGSVAQEERLDTQTKLPGEIVSFDHKTQKATVKLMYKPKVNGEFITPPELKEVRVIQPRGGGFAVTKPIKAGDPVMISFEGRDNTEYYKTGRQSGSKSSRMNSFSDAVATPGAYPDTKAHSNYDNANAFFGSEDHKNGVRISPDGTMSLTGAGGGEELLKIIQDLMQILIDSSDVEGPGFTPGVRAAITSTQTRLNSIRLE